MFAMIIIHTHAHMLRERTMTGTLAGPRRGIMLDRRRRRCVIVIIYSTAESVCFVRASADGQTEARAKVCSEN